MFGNLSRSLVPSVLALAMMLGASLAGVAPAAAQAGDVPPDLPAMLLRTEHIAEAGFEDAFFPYGGNCIIPDQEARGVASSRDMDPTEVLDQLNDVGWQLTCGQPYALPGQGSAPPTPAPPDVSVTSYVHLYDDAEGAEAGFEFFEDESHDPDAEDLSEGDNLGDQSEATLTAGSDDIGEYQSLDLAFRLDNLVGGVTIRDYTGETPEYETVEVLADVLQERIETVLDGGGPGLSPLVLRLEGNDLPLRTDRYALIDGDGEQLGTETEDEFAQRLDNYGRAEAVYTTIQRIPAGGEETTDDYAFGVNVYQFRNERAATAWLEDVPQHYEDDPDVFDVVVRDDAPQFGDESLSIGHGETLSSGQPLVYDRIVARVGNIGINIGFRGTMVPQGITEQIIEDQLACIEDGACTDTIPVPEALLGDVSTSATTPETGTETPAADAGDMESYASEIYPYTLSYGEDWTFEEPQVIGETEILSLSNGTSGVVIIADSSHEGDVESCLDGAVAYVIDDPESDNIELMEDENGDPLEIIGNDVAFAAYTYTDADGAEMVLYAECRVIVPGESTLEFNQFVALDDFDDQAAAREDLLDGLRIDE